MVTETKTYIGTISISRNLTAHCFNRQYEIRQGSRVSKMTLEQTVEALTRLTPMLTGSQGGFITIGQFSFQGKELKAVWNTALSYLKLLDADVSRFTDALSRQEEDSWARQEGIIPELKEPIEGDDL